MEDRPVNMRAIFGSFHDEVENYIEANEAVPSSRLSYFFGKYLLKTTTHSFASGDAWLIRKCEP